MIKMSTIHYSVLCQLSSYKPELLGPKLKPALSWNMVSDYSLYVHMMLCKGLKAPPEAFHFVSKQLDFLLIFLTILDQ